MFDDKQSGLRVKVTVVDKDGNEVSDARVSNLFHFEHETKSTNDEMICIHTYWCAVTHGDHYYHDIPFFEGSMDTMYRYAEDGSLRLYWPLPST
ncbi:hypothetical protein Q4610_20060 [Sphingobium sp. HBC34]|uniref:Uncharacterized protein n=1 Tax=Sphingobium cyanobacteriorum TaxID=3063954 RepID=A0ABT8ZS33_9SPHN|nr:hypothetical protein [Sphingobium sp. HBC34]MDO7837344.1 hypothetical protein [Sphingobium sp. HBC34]